MATTTKPELNDEVEERQKDVERKDAEAAWDALFGLVDGVDVQPGRVGKVRPVRELRRQRGR